MSSRGDTRRNQLREVHRIESLKIHPTTAGSASAGRPHIAAGRRPAAPDASCPSTSSPDTFTSPPARAPPLPYDERERRGHFLPGLDARRGTVLHART